MFKNSISELNQIFLVVVINISISTILGILQNYSVEEMRS